MQWLASICVRRPVFATVIILTIVVVGFVGYKNLAVDRFPNVDLPIVTVVTTLPGASPQEIETEVSDKIEEAINTISGIDELRSISTEGASRLRAISAVCSARSHGLDRIASGAMSSAVIPRTAAFVRRRPLSVRNRRDSSGASGASRSIAMPWRST